jgi:hypothetical protein
MAAWLRPALPHVPQPTIPHHLSFARHSVAASTPGRAPVGCTYAVRPTWFDPSAMGRAVAKMEGR